MALGVAFIAAGMAILCLNSGYCDSIWSCTFHVLLIWKIYYIQYICAELLFPCLPHACKSSLPTSSPPRCMVFSSGRCWHECRLLSQRDPKWCCLLWVHHLPWNVHQHLNYYTDPGLPLLYQPSGMYFAP